MKDRFPAWKGRTDISIVVEVYEDEDMPEPWISIENTDMGDIALDWRMGHRLIEAIETAIKDAQKRMQGR